MIKGKIENGLHPKIKMEVAGKAASKKFSALVDTGFDNDEESAVGTRLLQGSVVTMDFVKNKLAIAEPRRKR